MWPVLLDMTKEESIQHLRHLELEAYSSLVSALRAQGPLDQEKKRILRETSLLLNISKERHKAEIRRAISDEKLTTVAYHMTGHQNFLEEWALEGRRLVPLLPRTPPQTTYSAIADEASDSALQYNKELPLPANTERQRPAPQTIIAPPASPVDNGKSFRVPELPKEEVKKRKLHGMVPEGSSLAQHLMSNKLSTIQQIYRQVSKYPKQKLAPESESVEKNRSQPPAAAPCRVVPKINIIQNITLPRLREEPCTAPENSVIKEMNENTAPLPKPNKIVVSKQPPNDIVAEQSTRKIIKSQKVIVVPTTQPLPAQSNSILQKSLTMPINKFAKFNLDKFKIVSNSQLPPGLQMTNNHHQPHNSALSPKPKLVTIKGSASKKVIPLSQLQMLNPKGGLKMVPYCGKMLPRKPQTIAPKGIRDVTYTTGACSPLNVAIESDRVRAELNGSSIGNGDISNDAFEQKVNKEFRVGDEINCNDLELVNCDSPQSSESSDEEAHNNSEDSNGDIEKMDVYRSDEEEDAIEMLEIDQTEEMLQ